MQQDEYEELFRYTVVTPRFEQCVSKLPEPASEQRPADRASRLTDDASHHKTPGSMPKAVLSLQEQWYNFYGLHFLIASVWKVYVPRL